MNLTADIIQKYKKKSTATLKRIAITRFNKWIRKRDEGEPCISCGSSNTSEASHFYSAGHYNHMRFLEDNVHLSCRRCNYFLSGNLLEYRKRLEPKIGVERLVALDMLAADKSHHKDDRINFIMIIQKYKL